MPSRSTSYASPWQMEFSTRVHVREGGGPPSVGAGSLPPEHAPHAIEISTTRTRPSMETPRPFARGPVQGSTSSAPAHGPGRLRPHGPTPARPSRLPGRDQDPAEGEPTHEHQRRRGDGHRQAQARLEGLEQERDREPRGHDERPERRREGAAEEQAGGGPAVGAARGEAGEEEEEHRHLEADGDPVPPGEEVPLLVGEAEEEEERGPGGDARHEEERTEEGGAPERPRAERREQDSRVDAEGGA